ncbi:hypothetical protein RHMOL_Rhmol07G0254900 [Rhododendron molle]|uniref:Uncharacterized protein n=1 Tax=Rhododendron molle TaxID=49168 RepID=A0ACC0N6K0_RHOML|nr:hypothetical protein RHMOL_Rhmol07G0254900 [Rhododendron molle]
MFLKDAYLLAMRAYAPAPTLALCDLGREAYKRGGGGDKMSSENLEIMEDATSKKEVKNSTTVIDNTPWYCYLGEAIRVFLRCLGFENHESTKSRDEKEVVEEDSFSSIISSEKDGENCEGVNEPSHAVQDSSGSNAGGGGSGATDPAASTTDDPDAADSPSTPDPALASPAIISLEDTATTAARRSSRPPINSGSGPQTN